MATIVTVHGTYSEGPEAGSQWWQRGSRFESTMRELVEGEDGKLDFVPFRWDGLNSETSRRDAGGALAARLIEIEQQRQKFCVVGHSHGGSVILAALTQCIYRRRPLTGLSRWITVGTPFIRFARKTLLFSRLGVFGKAAWVSMLTFFALICVGMTLDKLAKPNFRAVEMAGTILVLSFAILPIHVFVGWVIDRKLARSGIYLSSKAGVGWMLPQFGLLGRFYYLLTIGFGLVLVMMAAENAAKRSELPAQMTLVAVLLVLPLVFRWVRRRLLDRWQWFRFGRVPRADLAKRTFSVWLALRHPQDEAVEGLRRASRVSFPIFAGNFATSSLTFMGVLLLPILTVAALLTPSIMMRLSAMLTPASYVNPGLLQNGRLIGAGHDFAMNLRAILVLPIVAIFGKSEDNVAVVEFLIFTPLMFLAGAVAIVAITRVFSTIVSRLLSLVLNRVAWQQIRASAYGNDTQGETSVTASDAPGAVDPQPALPEQLANKISTVADAAAAGTLSKFRTSLNRLAFAGDSGGSQNLVADYLTWDELIHTAYFKVDLFNKYVAYVIANSEGFKPSARFIADPDYLRLAAWYVNYKVREEQAAAKKVQ